MLAEAVGTGLLVTAVIGSGIAAQRLSPGDIGLQLLENAIATGAALTVLIWVLQPVSAAFNPAVTMIDRLARTISTGDAAGLIIGQLAGGAGGAVLANLMFQLPAVSLSTKGRDGLGRLLAEVVATAGLVLVIMMLSRSGRSGLIAPAVGGYITAAYWFTSSTSFANPAVTIARMFSDTFSGIAPHSVPGFLLAQLIGALGGYFLARTLIPMQEHDRDRQPTH
ncbi:MAG: aquaporin [Microlunatus sp.]|nr:aquaporin [Microlunatus sp.]